MPDRTLCSIRVSGCLQVLFSCFRHSGEKAEHRLPSSEEYVLVSPALPNLMSQWTYRKIHVWTRSLGQRTHQQYSSHLLTEGSLISYLC